MKFLKPNSPHTSILDPDKGYPDGYCTKDGMWAAIPLANSKKFVIVNNGKILHCTELSVSNLIHKKEPKENDEGSNQISGGESKQDKWNRGLDIFIESVINQIPLYVSVLTISYAIMN